MSEKIKIECKRCGNEFVISSSTKSYTCGKCGLHYDIFLPDN